ncbi:FAD-binding monooxygenase [Agrococcus carbonis]|uniref:Phenol 2-monooxygenase n=1 Tax=Agrococcus carbonis TaxID=684552 RepID=A0A1H1LTA4_9MICO|nr:FAD-binding monooxygenase [Agrococcus carbonis]SDR77009.1 phenol 2-monooxygenase [Agrococcus carbonis]
MQFHHHGYVSTDPRVQPAAGVGLDRPATLTDEVDVLIVGTGPAGMITAAQLAQFPDVHVRIIERRPGRLEIGQADGIQCRTVETFQAFGFAEAITAEAYEITEMAFWGPDPKDPSRLVRTASPLDDPEGLSEFPHLVVNQARVLDYFAEAARNAPGRVVPDYGWEFEGLEVTGEGEHPVTVHLLGTAHEQEGRRRTIRAKYVVGADGARSGVRRAIGCTLAGQSANHAWGVMDVLANSDFPDIRVKSAIQSASGGNILLIPREGGFLFRMYVDLGEVPEDSDHSVRQTPIEEIIRKANEIVSPYTIDVKSVAWSSVYEVGHRITDRFDDVLPGERGTRSPRVFITGDACHTHSAKAGQGMNVSMQDGYNIGWKLGHVLDGRAPESLLDTYSLERQVVAQNLIDFDKEWSTLMAKPASELDDPQAVADFYTRTMEFSAGFMTEYAASQIVGDAAHQSLATGFPIGKRFKSARVARVADTNHLHLGHRHVADGRYRVYVFADPAAPAEPSPTRALAEWLQHAPDSPIAVHTPAGRDANALLDIKVVYQRPYREIDLNDVPDAFKPTVGPFGLVDLENVFAALPDDDIFEARGIARDGAIVVVRPDQYVAAILPLTATDELAAYFRGALLPAA